MSQERYFLAGDSGGTKTNCILVSDNQEILTSFVIPGMASLHEGTLPCMDIAAEAASGIPGKLNPELVYFSLGGPNTEEVRKALQHAFPNAHVHIEREANGTLLSEIAHILDIQGAVLAGTGVTAVGFHNGSRRYAEGWGPVFGDRGSGAGTGMAAVKKYLREIDGLEPESRLKELLMDQLQGLDLSSFSDRMTFKSRINAISRQDLGALAPHVMRLALEGDTTAEKIIRETAEEIGAIAAAVLPAAGRILWLGGLFHLGAEFRSMCDETLQRLRHGENCKSAYYEHLSLGRIAAIRAMTLSGICPKKTFIQEILHGC